MTNIQKVIERKRELEEELVKLEHFIEVYNKLNGEIESVDKSESVASNSKIEQKPESVKPSELVNIVRKELEDNGRPMRRGELVERLTNKGIALAGSDKNKNLGTILWRAPDVFVQLKTFGYWLKDTPYPPAGYIPETSDEIDDLLD